ncbi:tripartite tricarboxylate transporter substrate-binding protein [Pseudorhodoplanes sp.]|uniref:tripartite tricarboxylate transporter substrate-binding protein n=1 Tax=Pseudorhodoplanes sp. TaxID=1934341 RepID=UPI0039C90769
MSLASRMLTMAAGLLGASVITGAATAQVNYPDKPIMMIVPAAAGGPSDTVARLVAEAMSAELGQRIVIENAGGAGGSIGAARVAKSAPDGYTLLLYHIGVATFGALYPNLPYKQDEAFDSVGLVTEVPLTLVGRKGLPPEDVSALLAWLKGKGAGATFGTAGVGAVSDLCGRLLIDATGIKPTVIPYKGTGPAMNDLVAGQIDFMCDQTTNTTNHIKSGGIKPYAATTRNRIAVLPQIPTLLESGVPGFDLSAWHAIWTPKGTPAQIREKLSGALQKALTDPKVIERFGTLGTAPVAAQMATPAALDDRFKSETARWSKLLAGAAQK